MSDIPLSVLDLAPVAAGTSAGQALEYTTRADTMVYDIEDRIRSFELITEKVAGGLAKPGN